MANIWTSALVVIEIAVRFVTSPRGDLHAGLAPVGIVIVIRFLLTRQGGNEWQLRRCDFTARFPCRHVTVASYVADRFGRCQQPPIIIVALARCYAKLIC